MSIENNRGFETNGFEEIGDEALESVAGGGFWGALGGAVKRGGKKLWKAATTTRPVGSPGTVDRNGTIYI